jgi:VCBS repeat protein
MFRYLRCGVILFVTFAFLAPVQAHSEVPATWCTHSTAQRLEDDVNGDGRLDAICHDRITGFKWVALREGSGLEERWTNTTLHWCSHAGAALLTGDVNGDRRADLICKDSRRIWVDYAGADFFTGTDFFLDTNWCTHAGAAFFVGDQNSDGRADLVCRGSDGFHWIDYADTSGQFGGTDVSGQASDFEVLDIIRSGKGYVMRIRNNGSDGRAEYFHCSPDPHRLANVLRIRAGETRTQYVASTWDDDVVTCSVEGRGDDGSRELFISNNKLRKRIR